MEFQIKRFSQILQLPQLTALSLTSALVSLQLLSLSPILQFLLAGAVISVTVLLYGGIERRKSIAADLFLFTTLVIFASPFLGSFLAVLFILGIGFVVFSPIHGQKMLYLAPLAHIADVVSTLVSQGSAVEANPVVGFVMLELGDWVGLITSKILLVFLPIIWAVRNITGFELDIFLKSVYVLGLSMAVRNLILFLSLK